MRHGRQRGAGASPVLISFDCRAGEAPVPHETSPMILCVGTTPVMKRSMAFSALHLDEVNRAVEVSDYASGKSINVAKVAHTLGEEVLATGFLGGDNGRFIRQDLNMLGVPHDFVGVEPRTRMCITVIDRGCGQVTELVEESREVESIAW